MNLNSLFSMLFEHWLKWQVCDIREFVVGVFGFDQKVSFSSQLVQLEHIDSESTKRALT